MAAWPSKKLSVRRSTTRFAVCSLPMAKLARLVLGVSVDDIGGRGINARREHRTYSETYPDSSQNCPQPLPRAGYSGMVQDRTSEERCTSGTPKRRAPRGLNDRMCSFGCVRCPPQESPILSTAYIGTGFS